MPGVTVTAGELEDGGTRVAVRMERRNTAEEGGGLDRVGFLLRGGVHRVVPPPRSRGL